MGAVCAGCGLAGAARLPVLPLALAAASIGAVALVVADPRMRVGAVAVAVALGGWAWGSVRLAELDRSALVSQVGAVEHAVVEVDEPPKSGSFDERARAVLLRWGTLTPREPVYLELPLG